MIQPDDLIEIKSELTNELGYQYDEKLFKRSLNNAISEVDHLYKYYNPDKSQVKAKIVEALLKLLQIELEKLAAKPSTTKTGKMLRWLSSAGAVFLSIFKSKNIKP